MEQIEINAQIRTVKGKAVKQLRRDGQIPAVLFGRGLDSLSLQFDAREARQAITEAGSSQLIIVRIPGERPVQALLRDFQLDPVRRELLHFDLYQVDMTREITAEVRLSLVGESPTVEQHQGMLTLLKDTVEIECLPGDLVDTIEVDLSVLTDVDMQITVGDLPLPPKVRILSDPEDVIVRVSAIEEAPEEEEEEIEFISEAGAEPELVGRGRLEEEEE